MTQDDFVKTILSSGADNKELEEKVSKQEYVYVKVGCVIRKLSLMNITIFPYGEFTVGNFNVKKLRYELRLKLKWTDYKKKWSLNKEDLQ